MSNGQTVLSASARLMQRMKRCTIISWTLQTPFPYESGIIIWSADKKINLNELIHDIIFVFQPTTTRLLTTGLTNIKILFQYIFFKITGMSSSH